MRGREPPGELFRELVGKGFARVSFEGCGIHGFPAVSNRESVSRSRRPACVVPAAGAAKVDGIPAPSTMCDFRPTG